MHTSSCADHHVPGDGGDGAGLYDPMSLRSRPTVDGGYLSPPYIPDSDGPELGNTL